MLEVLLAKRPCGVVDKKIRAAIDDRRQILRVFRSICQGRACDVEQSVHSLELALVFIEEHSEVPLDGTPNSKNPVEGE